MSILEEKRANYTVKEIEFKDIIDVSDTDYDILLDLSFPIIRNKIDYFISEMSFISNEKIDGYINLINKYIENESIEEDLYLFIGKYSKRKKIGTFLNYYLLNSDYELSIDSNDNYRIYKV